MKPLMKSRLMSLLPFGGSPCCLSPITFLSSFSTGTDKAMDPYIKTKLQKAETYFNAALEHAQTPGKEDHRDAGVVLGVAEVRKIEKYIKKRTKDHKENQQYITLIK